MDWGILLLSVALLLSHCDARKRAPRENLGSDGTGAGEAEEEGERWRPNVSDRLLQLLGIRQENGTYFLPHLMYDYDGLEPYMLERTVRVHHLGHHAAYTDRMNNILIHMTTDGSTTPRNALEHLMYLDDIIEDFRELYQNHGGGYVNHAFTFFVMGPVDHTKEEDLEPTGKVRELMENAFGTTHNAIERFSGMAMRLFGSGYVWMCLDNEPGSDTLRYVHTLNQNSPLTLGYRPILGIDLWEHAYYLQYQNKRADYVSSWWSLVAWDKVNLLLDAWLQADKDTSSAPAEADVQTSTKTEL